MVSGVAVIGLKWDGYDVQRADLDVFLEITEGLDDMPELRVQNETIPFRAGMRGSRPLAHKRPIVLSGYLFGDDTAAYRGYVDEVKQSFSPMRSEPGVLVATLEDGTERWIHAFPRDLRRERLVPMAAQASIMLEALDPFWYSAYGMATLDSGLELDDGEALDQGAPVTLTPLSDPHAFAIDTMSTAEVERIRIRMSGPSLGGPGIEVDTPEGVVGFELATPLLAGEELDLDNYARTILVAGSSRRWDMTLKTANRNGEYARLRPGVNAVRVLGQPAELRIGFTRTFL